MASATVRSDTAPPLAALAAVQPQAGLLRFSTAGSVDDGKSTLIGRLLYESKAVYEDQLASIARSGINRSSGPLDLSLLTDGLRAEREQGITIDVAYRYFSTPRRKFIIADTPGHEQYTRNMATGASTAHAAVVLIDATKGLMTQSRRHTYIASLLGIRHVIAAINKMDLVDYRQEIFERIAREFEDLAGRLGIASVSTIPVSALIGDNVVTPSARMPWFSGSTLLEHLEQAPVFDQDQAQLAGGPFRLPVQYVARPDHSFRGFAGRIASGTVRRGDTITVCSSGIRSRIKSIVTFDGELDQAGPGSSVTVTLEDEIDVSRGDMLAAEGALPESSTAVTAKLVWLNPRASDQQELYVLKHTTRTVRARLKKILYRVDVNTLDRLPASRLQVNDIAAVVLETTQPLFFDPYEEDRTTGSFILIDPITNATVAAGMIQSKAEGTTPAPSAGRNRSVPAAVWIVGRQSLAERLAQLMTEQEPGRHVQLISALEFGPAELSAVLTVLQRMNVTAIVHLPLLLSKADLELKQAVVSAFGKHLVFDQDLPTNDNEALSMMQAWLHDIGGANAERRREEP